MQTRSRASSKPLPSRTPSDADIHAPKCPARIHRPPTPPSPFRLLDLPPELQSCIAVHVLVSCTSTPSSTSRSLRPPATDHPTIRIRLPRFNRHPPPPPPARTRPRLDRPVPPSPPLSPSPSAEARDEDLAKGWGHTRLALLLACKRLYEDHWRTYYSCNTFEFADVDTFEGFVTGIPKRCAAEIRSVRFRMPHKYGHDRIWKDLAGLDKLEEVELMLHPASRAEDLEYQAALDGAQLCKGLKKVDIRRRMEGEEDKRFDDDSNEVEGDDEHEDGERGRLNAGDAVPGPGGQQQQEVPPDSEDRNEVEVLAKDRQCERKINDMLQQRHEGKIAGKRASEEDQGASGAPA